MGGGNRALILPVVRRITRTVLLDKLAGSHQLRNHNQSRPQRQSCQQCLQQRLVVCQQDGNRRLSLLVVKPITSTGRQVLLAGLLQQHEFTMNNGSSTCSAAAWLYRM